MTFTMPGSLLRAEADHAFLATVSPFVRTTLHETEGDWAAQIDLSYKTEPKLGAPYTAHDVRLILCDITAAHEHLAILNAGPTPITLERLKQILKGGN